MKARRMLVLAVAVAAALAAVVGASAGRSSSSRAAQVAPIPAFTPEQELAPAADDWITPHGDLFNQRYSSLTQITSANVAQLRTAFHTRVVIPTTGRPNFKGQSAEASPVEYKGTLYMPDSKFNVQAINASSGERLWYYKPKFPKGFAPALANRGVAIGDGKVYYAQPDAKIVALDQATGRVVWTKTLGNYKTGAFFSAQPQYFQGKLIVPLSGGDFGARCKLMAINASTGKLLWTFYDIPLKGQFGGASWPAKRAYLGGGAIWNTPTIDPKLGLVYVGTGNPVPYSGLKRGYGKELFTESVIAVHLNNGKLSWYQQVVHHDLWDFDFPQPAILADLTIKGKMRHVIAIANKDGWVYILDRKNGRYIFGVKEKPVPQNKAQHTFPTQPYPVGQAFAWQCAPKKYFAGKKAPDGQPYEKVGCLFQPYTANGFTAWAPSALGGVDWPPSAYSPDTGYMYLCSKDTTAAWKSLPEAAQKLKPLGNFFQIEGLFSGKNDPTTIARGRLVAMNLRTNRIAWQHIWPGDICYSGVATTAGNLVFVGRNTRRLEAYNAKTGKLLWRSPLLAASVAAPPMVYENNGKEYVAVYAGGNSIAASYGDTPVRYGSDMYAFALPT